MKKFCCAFAIALGLALATISAQVPGRNVNMVSGTTHPDGDPYLQRQNEPSIAASTRNPLHLLGGSNDYRTVDIPFPPDDDEETGDAWLGLFKSFDGGQRWRSGLLPGYPQDTSPAGLSSPLKAYQAGADAVVRAGTHGLIYYSGLVFNRGEGGKSGIFLSRFIDNNNKENGDPIGYLGTTMVATSNGDRFLDKPWMAVDIPRTDSMMCTVTADSIIATTVGKGKGKPKKKGGAALPPPGTQNIPAGPVYVAYTSITGEGTALKAEILLTRSTDCGKTWAAPMRVSRAEDPINQGANITIDPRDGSVYVAWRRFSPFVSAQNPNPPNNDALMIARLPYGGKKFDPPGKAHGFPAAQARRTAKQIENLFEHRGKKGKDLKSEEAAELEEFDQGSSGFSFRSNAYPTMATDGIGRVYIAWTQRGFPTESTGHEGARIVMVTTRDARTFTQPYAVDDYSQLGHQLMPTLAFAGGKLMLVYYDLRETKANTHRKFITDQATNSGLRQTIDIRAAMASPGDFPAFAPSVKVSDYVTGLHPTTGNVQQLQFNPPNFPMFRSGTTPFMGDYIDVTAAPAFVPAGGGKWIYNTAANGPTPVFHAAWTDNRDVRPPKNGDWTKYTPAQMSPSAPPRKSLIDPSIDVPMCEDGNAGSRNQNVYSARITGGLLAGSPGNAKPLSTTLQRAFVVYAHNTTDQQRSFRMQIRSQPIGGRASFDQFHTNLPPVTVLDMSVPPRSLAARTVYATSSDPDASIFVDVFEITDPGGAQPLGLKSTVILNPDVENPPIENPDPENTNPANPDVENKEVYNPDVENPDVENPDVENLTIGNGRLANPDVENPDVENPDPENPDVENVSVVNPDVENLNISNPDVENPDVENQDLANPDVENPDVENGSIADVTWKVSNTGNTTAGFNVNVFLANETIPAGIKTQLILFKTYRTPVTVPNGCQLGFQTRNVLLSSILHPTLIVPSTGGVPDQNDPSDKNASMWLAPGEEGRITLRVIDDDLSNNLIITKDDGSTVSIDPAFAPSSVTPAISSQGVGTDDKNAGKVDPPLVTPTGTNLFFLQQPSSAITNVAIVPAVAVQVRDNLTGTPVSGATVTLTIGNNPGEAGISGNIAVSNAGGIAVFPLLKLTAPGAGYTLMASAMTAGVVATAESSPFDVDNLPPVEIAMPSIGERTAEFVVPYALSLQADGGAPPYTWSIVSGEIPTGFSLDALTGIISGVSDVPGAYTFTVKAEDTLGSFDTLTICITVRQPELSSVSTLALNEGEPPLTIEDVAQTLLGQGVAISNVTLTGAAASAGLFAGGASTIGLNSGIILSSGSVHGAKGPNGSDNTTTAFGTEGDADLTALSGFPTHDASILDFDFVPSGDKVSFRYVFGSEEYNEFVSSQFNDVFGFFITGPGINGNFALVPGTGEPVSINSINGGNPFGTVPVSNPSLYRNNDPNDPGPATIDIQADGMTVVLTLTATVVPGETHHMKLAIADAGDFVLDSWVFIQSGSFHAIENCTNGIDDDADGLVDGQDPDCQSCLEVEQEEKVAAAFGPVSYPASPAAFAHLQQAARPDSSTSPGMLYTTARPQDFASLLAPGPCSTAPAETSGSSAHRREIVRLPHPGA